MRHSITFGVTFVITLAGVVGLLWNDYTEFALLTGFVGLCVEWALSPRASENDEVADASYFFGFLLTLVFLTIGLYKLGEAQAAVGGGGSGAGALTSTQLVLAFLKDLSTGLLLTVFGLGVRQIRTLAVTTRSSQEPSGASAQLELVNQQLKTLIEVSRERPESRVMQELERSQSIARGAVDALDKGVADAAQRMLTSVHALEEATTGATQTITRVTSGAGESFSKASERFVADTASVMESLRHVVDEAMRGIQTEVGHSLKQIEHQRMATAEALKDAQAAATKMRQDADANLREHFDLWRKTLEQSRTALGEAHDSLDAEYRRGMAGFASSARAFEQLTTQTVNHVEALPNPAERLSHLWDGVRQLESRLTEAIAGTIETLGVLCQQSTVVGVEFGRLAQSTSAAADSVGAGGDRLAKELERELQQMNRLVEEYVALLQETTSALGGRA